MGELSVFIEGFLPIPYFSADVEFSKNANSATAVESYSHIVVFVWRQLEFAFFGASTPVGALFIFRRIYKMSLYEQLLNAVGAMLLVADKKKQIEKVKYEIGGHNACLVLEKQVAEVKPSVGWIVAGSIFGSIFLLLLILSSTLENSAEALIMAAVGVVLCGIPFISFLCVYLYHYEKYQKGIEAFKINQKRTEEEIEDCKRQLSTLQTELDVLFKKIQPFLDVLPKTYQDLTAANYMLLVVKDGRADTLKEAMNLYEEQVHRWKMENILNNVSRMQQIQNEYISSAMEEITRNQSMIQQELGDIKLMQAIDLVTQ